MSKIYSILFGIIAGIFLCLLFRCDPKCPKIKTKIEYVNHNVEVPTEKIIYTDGKSYPIYVNVDPITKEIIVYRDRPFNVNVKPSKLYERSFLYKDTSISINGTANIVADSLYKFDLSVLKVNYTEKVITKTIEAKRRMNILLGSNISFIPTANFMQGVNFNIGLKTRKDFVFEIGYNINFNSINTYAAGVKFPLFHKKK